MPAKLLEQYRRRQVRSDKAAVTCKGAGGWVLVSQSGHENFWRTVRITFHLS